MCVKKEGRAREDVALKREEENIKDQEWRMWVRGREVKGKEGQDGYRRKEGRSGQGSRWGDDRS